MGAPIDSACGQAVNTDADDTVDEIREYSLLESTFKLIDHEFNYVTNWYTSVQTREVLN